MNGSFFDKMEKVTPKEDESETITLYKYLPFETLIEILKHGDLKITFREDANDPYELLPSGDLPNDHSNIKKDYGFISFSSNNNIPSLWGNYSDKYKGVCLEFQIPCFSEKCNNPLISYFCKIENKLKIISYYKDGIATVVGVQNSCLLGKIEYLGHDRATGFQEEAITSTVEQTSLTLAYLINKDSTWEHEQEWRVITSKKYASRCSLVSKKQMYFSNLLTKYITKIIITPYCEHTKESLEVFIPHIIQSHNQENSFGKNIPIVKAEFSETSFLLNIPIRPS